MTNTMSLETIEKELAELQKRKESILGVDQEFREPLLFLSIPKSNLKATGRYLKHLNLFRVYVNSASRKRTSPHINETYSQENPAGVYGKDRKQLLDEGKFIDMGDYYLFAETIDFRLDPSASASFLLGRVTNGPEEWKTADGITVREMYDLPMISRS